MQIKSLTGIGIEKIHEAFKKAFVDYAEPFNLSVGELQYMIERRGFNGELSYGAFVEEEMVGFTLNGLGDWNGKLTAYDTGTGVIKDYRQQKVASRIFDESLPLLKAQGVEQYLLEVIKINTKAVGLYKKKGFVVTREFDYYVSSKDQINLNRKSLQGDYSIGNIEDPDWNHLQSFWDFQPSWQNSIASVTRKLEHFSMVGVFYQDTLVGYGCMERSTGDIPQLAVHPNFRRQGLASELFLQLMELASPVAIKMINTWNDSIPIKMFLKNLGLKPRHGQYEMILKW